MFLSSRFLSKVAKSSVEAFKIKTPKKPLKPYPKFTQQQCALLNIKGDVISQELFKTVALKWRALPVEEKEQYKLTYQDELNKYWAEYESFVKSLTRDEKNHLDFLKKKKKKKELKSILKEYKFPTTPKNAFSHFIGLNKEIFHSALAKDGLKNLAAKWNTTSPKEKLVYFQIFEDQKKKYPEELAMWIEKMTLDNNKKALKAYNDLMFPSKST